MFASSNRPSFAVDAKRRQLDTLGLAPPFAPTSSDPHTYNNNPHENYSGEGCYQQAILDPFSFHPDPGRDHFTQPTVHSPTTPSIPYHVEAHPSFAQYGTSAHTHQSFYQSSFPASPPPTADPYGIPMSFDTSTDSAYTTLMTPPMPHLTLPSSHNDDYGELTWPLRPHIHAEVNTGAGSLSIGKHPSVFCVDSASDMQFIPIQVPSQASVPPLPRRVHTPVALPLTDVYLGQTRVYRTTPPLPPSLCGLFAAADYRSPLPSPPAPGPDWVSPARRPLPPPPQVRDRPSVAVNMAEQTQTQPQSLEPAYDTGVGVDDGGFRFDFTGWQQNALLLSTFDYGQATQPQTSAYPTHPYPYWDDRTAFQDPPMFWSSSPPSSAPLMTINPALAAPGAGPDARTANTMPFSDQPFLYPRHGRRALPAPCSSIIGPTQTQARDFQPLSTYSTTAPLLTTTSLYHTARAPPPPSSSGCSTPSTPELQPITHQETEELDELVDSRKRGSKRRDVELTKQRRFKCGTCPETFARRNDRERHVMCKHTAERPYRCIACGKSWARCDKYREHLNKQPECRKAAPPEHLKNKRARHRNFRI